MDPSSAAGKAFIHPSELEPVLLRWHDTSAIPVKQGVSGLAEQELSGLSKGPTIAVRIRA